MKNLILAMLKTGGGSAVAILCGVVMTKIIAVFGGAQGMGLFSLLRQAQQTFVSVGTLQGNTAIVQGMSSTYESDRPRYLFSTAMVILSICTLLCLAVWTTAPAIARFVLSRDDGQAVWTIRGLIPAILLASGVLYFGSILNGYRAIGRLALVQVIGAAAGAATAYPLVTWVGTPFDVLFLLWIISGTSLAGGVWFAWRGGWLAQFTGGLTRLWSHEPARYFLRFSAVTFITATVTTGTLLCVRAMFVNHGGLTEAGIFDAAWTINSAYLMLVLGSLGTYYTPVLSGLSEPAERAQLIAQVLRLIVMVIAPLLTIFVLLRPMVVRLLYSREFLPSLDIIQWMIIGDYLKAVSWVLVTPMLAFAHLRTYFWVELLWNLGMLGGTAVALFVFNMPWLVGALFTVLYILYCGYAYHYVRRMHGVVMPGRGKAIFMSGLVMVASSCLLTWNDAGLMVMLLPVYAVIITVFLALSATRAERERLFGYLRWS